MPMRLSPRFYLRASACALALALAACNEVATQERPLPSGPNVLLVTIDTLRADYVGAYQSGRETSTPTLDALAAEGVRFANAVSTVPLTLPSHTSILTGLYPPHHGVRHNSSFVAADELESVAERFQTAGYATGAVVGAVVLDKQFGLAQGFDSYDTPAPGHAAAAGSFDERDAKAVTERALDFVAKTDRPFFLWVHYYDPHRDYAPPEPYRTRFPKDPYAGEIAYVDAELGRLIAALRERGALYRTLVSVTADHGEGLGEHGEAFHTYLVYEGTQHVPWILRGPGVPAARVVDTTLSNAAIAQTLAELAGVGPLAAAEVASAVPLWRADAQPAEGWAYSESLAGQLEFGWAPLYAIRRGGDKFIDAPRAELYDLTSDPREERNLLETAAPPRVRVELAERLLAQAREGEQDVRPTELDPATRAQIEALGYVVPVPGASASGRGEDPKDVHHWAAAAQRVLAEFTEGDEATAAELARETLKRLPNAVRAHEVLARVYQRSGRLQEALTHAREAARLNPFYADYHALVGGTLLQMGDVAGAVRSFEEAARLRPDVGLYEAGLVWKLQLGGSPEEAERHARRAFELSPDDAALRDSTAAIFEGVGEYERALALYSATAERFPSHERTHMRLAIQYARLGEDARAAEHLARAGASARDPELTMRLAIAYAARGASERAEPILRELVARDSSPAPRALLARLLRETGRDAEARQLLQSGAPPAAPAPH